MRKIVVIGNYGIDGKLNGQTARTRTIYSSIINNYKEYKIIKIDTQKKSIINLVRLIYNIVSSSKIVIMPAKGSFNFITSMIKTFRVEKKTNYVVIGGWLYEFINNNNKSIVKSLKKYNGIFVQVKKLEYDLNSLGMGNVLLFPNYRTNNFLIEINSNFYKNRIVYYSRIREDKGALFAIEMIKKYNLDHEKKISLDFYGPIDDDFYESFMSRVNESEFIEYNGILNNNEIIDNLSKYRFMIFPTFYEGEGFPGAILESLMSGLPVIASDWKYNSDIIKDNYNGYIYELNNEQEFIKCLERLMNDEIIYDYKKNSLLSSKNFSEEKIFPILKNKMDRAKEK